jgi:hypothetical protein
MAIDSRVRTLIDTGQKLFSSRLALMTYWQDLAEGFYPERAEFTAGSTGGDWWAGAMTSEPVIVRRELAQALQSMLRPDGQQWFSIHVADDSVNDRIEVREYLEWATKVQRRAMYHVPAHFAAATKSGDNDWVTFGQAPIEIDVRRDKPSLVYRSRHLRDVAWTDNEYAEVEAVYHRWKPTARQLKNTFGSLNHSKLDDTLKNDPDARVNCLRVVLPRDQFDGERRRTPKAEWMSVYIDMDNEHMLEEVPYHWQPFIIPRWTRVSGSQYGWSPCSGPGLADARTLQAIVRVLLEAGEKAVDPPYLAKMEAIRSDVNLYAGGLTWQAEDYDERGGDALRPLSANHGGFPIGLEMQAQFSRILTEGFFLNKLRLPQDQGKMTAYEVRKRFEEHIRAATPLLTPAEDEYNFQICDRTFDVLSAVRAFGPSDIAPEAIRGRDTEFKFVSPLREMADELEAQKLLEAAEILEPAATVDSAQVHQIDWDKATRGALKSRGIPAAWMRSEAEFAEIKKGIQEEQKAAQQAAQVDAAAETATKVGQSLQQLAAPQQ